jgi:diaminohydroxyphosphoribosylaminopyrimidine deaminase/5-amino-6-(5-phosphoribosylamino)uracil reductase
MDTTWMARALELAERGRGHVEPNPLVGAVVTHQGQCLGEGWHQRYGGPHAEVHALDAAGDAARCATLCVTLEPCCHHGKTPPCTDAILRAGIARVVVAMADPFPEVAGKGTALLRQAGVTVEVGLLEAQARRLNAPYLKLLHTGQPYVHLKWAMTLDGKIATRTGDSRWISNEACRARVHALRGRMDAILVGIGTALADDPQLTARPPGPRTATRIVLDRHARLPEDSTLVRTAREVPTLIAVGRDADPARVANLEGRGCEVLPLATENEQVDLQALLTELGRRRFTNLLVEGGGAVLGSFRDHAAFDEVHVFLAPRLAGGKNAPTPMAGQGVERISQALELTEWASEMLQGNLYLRGRRASS